MSAPVMTVSFNGKNRRAESEFLGRPAGNALHSPLPFAEVWPRGRAPGGQPPANAASGKDKRDKVRVFPVERP